MSRAGICTEPSLLERVLGTLVVFCSLMAFWLFCLLVWRHVVPHVTDWLALIAAIHALIGVAIFAAKLKRLALV